MALPFATNAACFALGAVLVAARRDGHRGDDRAGRGRASLRAEMVEGMRWLMAHPPMRTLALTIFAFNVTYGAAWAVLVLYASERLGMDAVGFGLLTTAIAIGGIVGTVELRPPRAAVLAGRHHARRPADRDVHAPGARAHDLTGGRAGDDGRLRRARVRVGHDLDRGAPARRAGRAARPGRAASTASRSSVGSSSARRSAACSRATFGITAPFWFGFVGSALLVVILWRQFDHIVHASEA